MFLLYYVQGFGWRIGLCITSFAPGRLFLKMQQLKKTMKNVSGQHRTTECTTSSLCLTTTRTETSKDFSSQQGKFSKLVKIIQLNTVVVSSYHHPHKTYTEKMLTGKQAVHCFLGSFWHIMSEWCSAQTQHPVILTFSLCRVHSCVLFVHLCDKYYC